MTALMETLVQMNLTAGAVILAVMLARLLLRRFPRKFSYLLWIVVAFRLCMPFSLPSPVSLFNAVEHFDTYGVESSLTSDTASAPATDIRQEVAVPAPEASAPAEDVYLPEETPELSLPQTEVLPQETPPVTETPGTEELPVSPSAPGELHKELPGWVWPTLWLAGVACVLGYGLFSWGKARRLMATAVLLEGNVYGSDYIGSPFAMGVFSPRIYIPFGLEGEAKEYILAHERYHLRRRDHLVKLFAFGLLAVHWFNPLCWLAFNRMSLDMELSCDEGVLAGYNDPAMKKRYARTLLSFASERRLPVPSPVSFSETASAKARIKNALYWKKSNLWASALAIVLCLSMLLICGFDPMAEELNRNEQEGSPEESYPDDVVLPPEDLPPEPEKPLPPEDIQAPETVSSSLEYALNDDNASYTVVGIGTCTDTELSVPAYHPDGKPVTAIGKSAFAGSDLTSVYLPDTVTEVGTNAFSNCWELKTARLPKSASMGEGVFIYCEALEQVNLPENLKILPGNTFRGCASLQELYLPEGLYVIGNFAMENCRSVKELYLPDSVIMVQRSAFAECVSLEAVRVSPRAELDAAVFAGCTSLRTVNLPSGMTAIPYQLFDGCVSLSYVELPARLQTINSEAFRSCYSLTGISIPRTVTNVGDSAFCDSGLTKIVLSDAVTYLGPHAFQSCEDLASVRLPETLTLLRRYTFHGCTSLAEIHLPGSLEKIEDNVFGMCTSLKSIEIPEKVTEIREFCFSGCTSLTEVVLPDQVKTVWNYAFSQCSNLETVTMEGVAKISNLAFFHCDSLRSVAFSQEIQTIGGQTFLNCPSLGEIVYGGTVAQWNAVVKGAEWWPVGGKVVCIDGEMNG